MLWTKQETRNFLFSWSLYSRENKRKCKFQHDIDKIFARKKNKIEGYNYLNDKVGKKVTS
jgi:hypothetical protein